MKFFAQAAAFALLSASQVEAGPGHRHFHTNSVLRRHTHNHHAPRSILEGGHTDVAGPEHSSSQHLEKKEVRCRLPDHPDLVFVPGAQNGGFAMSPDQPCKGGMYCPIACKSGKVMNQWEPSSTYTYPASMNGGLFCDESGKVTKPFPDRDYCADGTGTISVSNTVGKPLSFCQTVLPGNEAMLIPTVVSGVRTLAVPGPSYWCSTSAHYYVNPPGTTENGCIWGDNSRPVGNWAPYIAGANTDATGNTYVTLGSNPIFEKEGRGLEKTKPSYGMRVKCTGGGCNGLPCEVGSAGSAVGSVKSTLQAVGAGGSSFCVVTVPQGSHAEIEIFSTDGTSYAPQPEVEEADDKVDAEGDDDEDTLVMSTMPGSSSSTDAESSSSYDASTKSRPTLRPGIFHENSTTTAGADDYDTSTSSSSSPSGSAKPATVPTGAQKGEGRSRQQGSAAISGLIVALVAAACFY